MFEAEALIGPGMGDPGPGQEASREPVHVSPDCPVPLASPAQGASPEVDDVVAKSCQGTAVGWHGCGHRLRNGRALHAAEGADGPVIRGCLAYSSIGSGFVTPTFDEAACNLPDTTDMTYDAGLSACLATMQILMATRSHWQSSSSLACSSQHRPTPVVYISGGPGGPLTVYAGHQARKPYAPGRDLILVDQRGTRRSEPDVCRALNPRLLRWRFSVVHIQSSLANRLAGHRITTDSSDSR